MRREVLRSNFFSNLSTIMYFMVGGLLIWQHENISTTLTIALLILLGVLISIMELNRLKKIESTFSEKIEGIIYELRGGKFLIKKMFWLNFFCGLALIFNGIVNSTVHDNFKMILIVLGVYYLLIGLIQLLLSKKRQQIRITLTEGKLVSYEMLSKQIILMQDVERVENKNEKIRILSSYNEKIIIKKKDFIDVEFDEFYDGLKIVISYWENKKNMTLLQ